MADKPDSEEYLDIKPCRHYQRWVYALADDTLTGPARWYIQWHIHYCHQCRATLKALQALRERLHRLADTSAQPTAFTLSPERRLALESALDEIERKNT